MQAPIRSDGGIDAIYQVWKRRKWLAIGVFSFCYVSTASFVFSLPSIYRATATVMLDGQGPGGDAGQGGVDSRLDSVTEEVMSRDRLAKLIDRYHLYSDLLRRSSEQAVITRMRQDIRIDRKASDDPNGQNPIFALDVSFRGTDPQVAADVTNALVNSFVTENNSIRAGQAAATVGSLQEQLAAIKQKLDSQQQRIDSFRQSHIGELPEQQTANIATLQQLNAQLQENSTSEIEAINRRENLLKQMTASGDASLDQLEQELASLRTRYTDKYPDVVRLEAQIKVMKRQQAQGGPGGHKAASPLQQQFQAVDAEIAKHKQEDERLRAQIAAYQGRVENVPLRAQQLQALSQGYSETQDVYSSLLKQYEQAKLAQSSGGAVGSQYRILDPAVVPREAAGPARMRLILMAFLLSFGIAAAAVFAAEQLNVSFHNVDELRAFTRLPVLATVPQIVTPGDAWRGRFRFGFVTLSVVAATLITAEMARLLGHGSTQFVWMIARHS